MKIFILFLLLIICNCSLVEYNYNFTDDQITNKICNSTYTCSSTNDFILDFSELLSQVENITVTLYGVWGCNSLHNYNFFMD